MNDLEELHNILIEAQTILKNRYPAKARMKIAEALMKIRNMRKRDADKKLPKVQ